MTAYQFRESKVCNLLNKTIKSFFNDGILATLRKIFIYFTPSAFRFRSRYRQMLKAGSIKDRFDAIYEMNLWRSNESGSGTGSTFEYTQNIREHLPVLVSKFNIQSILDLPCGDFNWMPDVLEKCPDLKYLGGDIVKKVIDNNIQSNQLKNVSFKVMDIRYDELGDFDLIFVRDCLFHLSFDDIFLALNNIKKSNIKYLMTTTHIFDRPHRNHDILTGDFRLLDLYAEPFSFPEHLHAIEDYLSPEPPRQMVLIEVKALP